MRAVSFRQHRLVGRCWDATWYVNPQTPLTVCDRLRVCNYMCVFVCERDGCLWALVHARVRAHAEVRLCVTFSVSIFLGSGESRVM